VAEALEKDGGRAERVRVDEIVLEASDGTLNYRARPNRVWAGLAAAAQHAFGAFEAFMGSNTFLTFFGAAFLLAKGVDIVMTFAFGRWMAFQELFFAWFWFTLPATIIVQLGIILWLIGTKIPTMIDNSYKHLNRADNLRSLPRTSS
jgi:hypothetical protein